MERTFPTWQRKFQNFVVGFYADMKEPLEGSPPELQLVVVGEEEVVVSALGGLAGAPAAVLSRLPVSQHHEPGDQDPGAGGVFAEQVAQFQLLQVLPLAGLQGGDLSEAKAGFPAGRSLSHPQF